MTKMISENARFYTPSHNSQSKKPLTCFDNFASQHFKNEWSIETSLMVLEQFINQTNNLNRVEGLNKCVRHFFYLWDQSEATDEDYFRLSEKFQALMANKLQAITNANQAPHRWKEKFQALMANQLQAVTSSGQAPRLSKKIKMD